MSTQVKNFQISIEFDQGDGDRDRSLSSVIPNQKGVHQFSVQNPFSGASLLGFAAVHGRENFISFHWEEGEAFDALLDPELADLIEIDKEGVAWE